MANAKTHPPTTGKPAADWRATLEPDDRRQIEEAARYAAFWAGMTNNSPLMLIDKLARLLDEKGINCHD